MTINLANQITLYRLLAAPLFMIFFNLAETWSRINTDFVQKSQDLFNKIVRQREQVEVHWTLGSPPPLAQDRWRRGAESHRSIERLLKNHAL